ncbi:GAF domain-containing protein [Cellulomonas sp. 179-A 4D5 NHS]|uniref:GAF domain-containing protein n=1 Tax=Cellulomonas sp. 179-A 4D5 NHS TaxID=3142378 RepID=UPI00399EF3CB
MHHYLDDFASGAAARLGMDTHCSIIVMRAGSLEYVGSSDERAERCDAVEVAEGVGPCVTAMQQLSGVLIPDLRFETRWRKWREVSIAAGFRSAAGLPAYVDEETTVALDLYSDALDPWTREMLVGMDAYVQEIAGAVRKRL